jgi:hypothetical protein
MGGVGELIKDRQSSDPVGFTKLSRVNEKMDDWNNTSSKSLANASGLQDM